MSQAPEVVPAGFTGARVVHCGIVLEEGLSRAEWEEIGRKLTRITELSAWMIGDWASYGQWEYGSAYREACEALGLEYKTVRQYAWVAGKFSHHRRRESLSFNHHLEVASLSEGDQEHWLSEAERLGLSKNSLRLAVAGSKHVEPRVETDADLLGSGPPVGTLSSQRDNQAPPTIVMTLVVPTARYAEWKAAADAAGLSLDDWLALLADEACGHDPSIALAG